MKYIVATNEGHGNWNHSEELETEQEVLEYIAQCVFSTEYKVLSVVSFKFVIEGAA